MEALPKSRTETWLTLIVLAVGLPLAAVARLLMYMNITTMPLPFTPWGAEIRE